MFIHSSWFVTDVSRINMDVAQLLEFYAIFQIQINMLMGGGGSFSSGIQIDNLIAVMLTL